MKQVRVALIGAGYIAHYHARALRELDGAEIAVVCDRKEEIAKKFADEHQVPEVCTIALELAKRDDVDAIVLGVPNKYHADYAKVFLEFGKDVLIEKPMAINAAEGKEIAATSQKFHRLVMVGHMWRFDEEARYIREIVQSGQIGRIVKTRGYGIHENWGPAGWFVRRDLAGGGALADMGVHAIDTVRYVLGDPRAVRVYARIGTFYGDYDVDDTGIIVITWDNGVTSVIESGWWHPHVEGPEAASRLWGTKGYASIFPTTVETVDGEKVNRTVPTFPERQEHCDQVIYTRQMAHRVYQVVFLPMKQQH
ncbi:MAG: Gfo/Idh/MocA family oxidoreductase [Phycisphaerales bacterium]|nr:MAG: Gfo/Idh/MocA family oxidoreductase [Phycisphaerales bacterium]